VPSTLRPKLVVRDATAAIAFYEKAFGARVVEKYTAADSVVMASLELLGGTISLKDEDDADHSPARLGGVAVIVDVTCEDPDAIAERAVAAGAELVFPVADQPYGARGGRVRDPYGHEWLLQTQPSMTPDEIQRAIDEMTG
jgi:PhnB protein